MSNEGLFSVMMILRIKLSVCQVAIATISILLCVKLIQGGNFSHHFQNGTEKHERLPIFILYDISFEMRDKRTKKMSHPFISTLIVCDFCCQRDGDK